MLMRRMRATISMAAVWGIGGMILGATWAMVLLRFRKPEGISSGEVVWLMARGCGTSMALTGAAFAISLGVWSRVSPRRTSGKGWIAAGAVGAAIVSNLTVLPRLLILHIPVPIFRYVAIETAIAVAATIGTVVIAERSARRSGDSLLRRGDSVDKLVRGA